MSDEYDEFAEVAGTNVSASDEDDYPETSMCLDEGDNGFFTKFSGGERMWSVSGESYFPCEKAVDVLESGQYLVRYCDTRGYYFQNKSVNLDDLINLPDNNSDKVLEGISNFWTLEKAFRQQGFLWKRGVLLWGPPGSGKTSTVQQLSKRIVDKGGIAIYCTYPRYDAEGLRILRRIEPKRPIAVIIEDIDAIIKQHGESDLLAMLDGELQVDNVVFIATTNYPENLDKRFVNRPSRFDEVVKIGMPSAECRRTYLSVKNKRLFDNKAELDKWVDTTHDFSIAHLKELIVSVECLGKDVDDTVARLRKMIDVPVTSEGHGRKFGISSSD